MWFELSVEETTFTALLIAISALIIKDYVTFFKRLFERTV